MVLNILDLGIPSGKVLPPVQGEADSGLVGTWTPQSWRKRPAIAQDIEYQNALAHEEVLDTVASLPPLVSTVKIELARQRFAAAARGEAFILQGGDCAESFQDVRPLIVQQKVQLLHEQSRLISDAMSLPVVTVGRIAGQYAKPRSSPFETLADGSKTYSFRGENINGAHLSERTPDPSRLLQGYFHARATLDLMKSCSSLSTPPSDDAVAPVRDQSFDTDFLQEIGQGAIFTSHEALHLPYESAVTHGHYNTSATFVWIGERTRQLNGPHIEYIRGIRNPIGIKVGPSMHPEELVDLLNTVLGTQSGKKGQAGRVTLITRVGVDRVEKVLPPLIHAVQKAGHLPVWMCDPCHGNTKSTPSGIKTRCVETMAREVIQTFHVHQAHGSFMGGLHLEQTGEFVTECVDAWDNYSEQDLTTNYRSLCDPRLSYIQALTVVQLFLRHVRQLKSKAK
ncbi:class II DAHP synthetase family protein [Aspergillus avenaceus]|uniref:Phospho-2-dehydro-3-deoxyheptonate aldolase n=1 Tax=Aspergillus avenaceus TaxID=36643 RepID=A0A5N6TR20_ASPAV|nr:class II DAHP synthetase family protein [Aspergillus avenaceus]